MSSSLKDLRTRSGRRKPKRRGSSGSSSARPASRVTPSPRHHDQRRLISRKADAEAVARVTTEIRGRVDGVESKAAEFVVPEPIGAAADGIFSTKCLACNRPYQYPQKQEIPEVPRQRSLGVMPPSATADLDVAGTRAPVDRRQVRIATPPRRLRADDFALAMEAPDVFLAMQQRKQRTKQKVVINARVAPPVGRHSFDSPGSGLG